MMNVLQSGTGKPFGSPLLPPVTQGGFALRCLAPSTSLHLRLCVSLCLSLGSVLAACGGTSTGSPTSATKQNTEVAFGTEAYRPQFHFSPRQNWMNDPNGLIYNRGKYHLFFQYNPKGISWGHMSWGHAISQNLIHWKQQPVALPEQPPLMIFSGSVVEDADNRSGLCAPSVGDRCLVAIFTGSLFEDQPAKKNQAQYLAVSDDGGFSWRYPLKEPVLDLGMRDFRDPKVFWDASSQRWLMLLALPNQHKLRFYASANLREWKSLSEFGPLGSTVGVWECPDLFPLPVVGTQERKWVLEVDVTKGAPAGGSGAQAFLGKFDGTQFIAEGEPFWVDYGADFYAENSWLQEPFGRRVWIAWMSNWDYAKEVPTRPWRGSMTLPRQVKLVRDPDRVRLIQEPIKERETLRGTPCAGNRLAPSEAANALAACAIPNDQGLELELRLEARTTGLLSLDFTNQNGEMVSLRVNFDANQLVLDRGKASSTWRSKGYSTVHRAPIVLSQKPYQVRVIVDRSSLEVFSEGGRVVLTEQVFPSAVLNRVALVPQLQANAKVSFSAWPIASAL